MYREESWLSWLESRTCGINQRVLGSKPVPRIRDPRGGAENQAVTKVAAFFIDFLKGILKVSDRILPCIECSWGYILKGVEVYLFNQPILTQTLILILKEAD